VVLRQERRSGSTALLGPILALILAVPFLSIIGYAAFMAATTGDGGRIDVDFLILGILIGSTGVVHLGAGMVVLWAHRALPASASRLPLSGTGIA